MPRPGRNFEKSKDFKGSMLRLLKNLSPWRFALSLALILAMVSAILSLIAPNRLSDLTDVITGGLTPNTDKLTEIGTKISENITNNMQTKMPIILSSESISSEDKLAFQNALSNISKENAREIFTSIPESILKELLEEIEVDHTKISIEDQIEFLKLSQKTNDKEKALKIFDKFPKSIYSLVKPKMDLDEIKNIAIFLGTIYLLSALFGYIQSFSMATVSNRFAQKLRSNISTKINTLPLKYFDKHETGDVLSRITNDVDTVAQNLNHSLATLVSSLTLFLGSIFMMFITNGIMAITAIIASLLGFGLMFVILGKSQKYFIRRQKELGDINGYIEEMYSGHTVVKAYNGTKEAIDTFDNLNEKLYESNFKSQFLSGMMQPIMGFVGNFGYVAVCVVGALLVFNNNITFGVIVAFMIYVRLFTNPLSQIAQAMTSLQSVAASSERVFDFLDEEEMKQESITQKLDKKDVKGNIEFKHVSFGYDENRTIIKDFSAKIKAGQKIALVGPTGAGKTTMVNLLMKFYDINKGDIIIDGKSIKDLSRENIHSLFCMVLQDTWVYEGTIKENIKFNQENVSDEEIWDACRKVGIEHFVKTLPGGLDAQMTDTDTISQGQKQLFTIARGMIEKAPFLILDEATSNVDTRTEELVQKAMDNLMKGKTSFIIAHRLSTIRNADLILVMNEGDIIEQGTHDELMAKKGFYEKLYNSQFEKTI